MLLDAQFGVCAAVNARTAAADIASGLLLWPVNKGGRMAGQRMTAQAIFAIVVGYGRRIGLEIAWHDLRRTFAKS